MLRLLLELFEEPSGADSPVAVIPVVVDDYEGHSEIIRATTRAFGATLLVVSDGAEGVHGTIDDAIQVRIEGLLQVPRAGGGRSQVTLTEEDGLVRAGIDGIISIPSKSQREVAGLAATLFSDQLHRTDTALIVYNEDVLDDDWADAVWRLFREVARTGFMRISRIILLIERSAGDTPENHLDDEPSVRFLLHSSALMRRKPNRVNVADVRHIAQRAADDGLVLFLGAGFSRSSGLPLGDSLRDESLGGFLGIPGAGIAELAPVFYEYLRENERLLEAETEMPREEFHRRITLERVLREEIWRSGANESATLRRFEKMNAVALGNRGRSVGTLHKIVAAISDLVIVTVNFDTLIESSEARVHKIMSDGEFGNGLDYLESYAAQEVSAVPLLKLHGSIEARETIVATVDQTAQGLSTAKERCVHAILDDSARRPWIYVGYSMRDPDTWSVLQSRAFADRVDEYWVSPFGDPNALAWCSAHRQFGQDSPSFRQRCITMTSDRFLEELLEVWSTQSE